MWKITDPLKKGGLNRVDRPLKKRGLNRVGWAVGCDRKIEIFILWGIIIILFSNFFKGMSIAQSAFIISFGGTHRY